MSKRSQAYRITNCGLGERCSRDWETLESTPSASARYCDRCDSTIHLCSTLAEVLHHAGLDNAVAFRRKSSHTPPEHTLRRSRPRLQ